MSHHHGSKHGGHGHHAHGGSERPAHLFWTKRRLAVVAVIALLAMGIFVVLSACEQGPQPKGPAQVVGGKVMDKPEGAKAAGVPMPASPSAASPGAAAAPGQQAGSYAVSGPDGDQTVIEVGGLTLPKPMTWVWTQPTMQFRALQYAVPAIGVNSPAAELVFSVFPGGDGGPIGANLDRWAGQFREGEGMAAGKRGEREVAGLKVSTIESTGAYMGMGAAAPRPGYMQLGAIVQAPGRNVFIKLVGPQATVESNRAAFEAMVAGMQAK
ncbi:MAG: hypothetical protein FJ260_11120 [Planctomycetes bacterium]|nr:hypothetical protein [Planctomycetota bacterium]